MCVGLVSWCVLFYFVLSFFANHRGCRTRLLGLRITIQQWRLLPLLHRWTSILSMFLICACCYNCFVCHPEPSGQTCWNHSGTGQRCDQLWIGLHCCGRRRETLWWVTVYQCFQLRPSLLFHCFIFTFFVFMTQRLNLSVRPPWCRCFGLWWSLDYCWLSVLLTDEILVISLLLSWYLCCCFQPMPLTAVFCSSSWCLSCQFLLDIWYIYACVLQFGVLLKFLSFLFYILMGQVVWSVTPALHTPLMAVTNAISGIIVLGAMLVLSPATAGFSSAAQSNADIASGLAIAALLFANINIFGGFYVTQKMLSQFLKSAEEFSDDDVDH